MTQTPAPSPPLPLDHFSLSLLCLLGRGGIGEVALGHSFGLTTPVAPLLGRLAHLAGAVHLVLLGLATTLLGFQGGLPVLILLVILAFPSRGTRTRTRLQPVIVCPLGISTHRSDMRGVCFSWALRVEISIPPTFFSKDSKLETNFQPLLDF